MMQPNKLANVVLTVFFGVILGEISVRADENPLFGYTHRVPSPLTLPAGRLVLGTDVAFGLTDFLQVGTNLFRDVYQIYNANAKISILDQPEYAFALTVGYENFNFQSISDDNPDLRVSTWLPGAVWATELAPNLAGFVAGNLSFSKYDLNEPGLVTAGVFQGASAETDISWAYSPGKKGVGHVLSAGLSYDFTYDLVGFGISHHWPGFHLGIHYFPNAKQDPVQPILAGGASIDI